ncbi:hypothetical protein T492DRAFT_1138781 [Pavlovales sp. CCMP2436]|nr:hypothetical protein T492DRAFT_1138781 [Pavlovales sp. CCMP2436]
MTPTGAGNCRGAAAAAGRCVSSLLARRTSHERSPLYPSSLTPPPGACPQEVALSFSDNEAFLFAGLKHCTTRIPPGGSYSLIYNLMPISAGHVPLPPLQVVARPAYGGAAIELVDNSEPRLVFVMPQPLATSLP